MTISICAPYAKERFETARQHSILHPERIVANPSPIGLWKGCPLIRPKPAVTASDRRLHCEDGAEPGFALRNAFIGLDGLRQWVSLDDRFDFPLRHEIKSFIEIFGAVLLTADDADALHDEIHQRDGKWLRVRAHSDQPAVWP